MRSSGRGRQSGIYGALTHSKFLALFKLLSSLSTIPFHPNVVNFEARNEITEFEFGDYRVVYQVDTKMKVLTIYHVRHRSEAYRKR